MSLTMQSEIYSGSCNDCDGICILNIVKGHSQRVTLLHIELLLHFLEKKLTICL